MECYKNLSGNSGVAAFETGPDFIRVRFHSGETYTYTYGSAGQQEVEQMKKLAASGLGLSTFISAHVHEKFERK